MSKMSIITLTLLVFRYSRCNSSVSGRCSPRSLTVPDAASALIDGVDWVASIFRSSIFIPIGPCGIHDLHAVCAHPLPPQEPWRGCRIVSHHYPQTEEYTPIVERAQRAGQRFGRPARPVDQPQAGAAGAAFFARLAQLLLVACLEAGRDGRGQSLDARSQVAAVVGFDDV